MLIVSYRWGNGVPGRRINCADLDEARAAIRKLRTNAIALEMGINATVTDSATKYVMATVEIRANGTYVDQPAGV